LVGRGILLYPCDFWIGTFQESGYFDSPAKGQLISECLFDILNFPRNQRGIWQISALGYQKWSNHKIKAHYNDFDTNIIRRCHYFRCFFGKFKKSKRHSEINWPLVEALKMDIFFSFFQGPYQIRLSGKWNKFIL